MTTLPTDPEPGDLPRLFERLAAQYPSRGLGKLLSLRGDDAFARQDLARMLTRDESLAERLRIGHIASTVEKPSALPLTARDVIDFYGYRVIHVQTVANALSDVVGQRHFSHDLGAYWEWAIVVGTYAVVLTEKLQRFEDEAFPGTLIRCVALHLFRDAWPAFAQRAQTHALDHEQTSWEAERDLFGVSHLDLARALATEWGLPETYEAAFVADAEPNSLAEIIVRSQAAAARHGHDDPTGAPFPAPRIPEREPILDAFAQRVGGTDRMRARIHSFLVTAHVAAA